MSDLSKERISRELLQFQGWLELELNNHEDIKVQSSKLVKEYVRRSKLLVSRLARTIYGNKELESQACQSLSIMAHIFISQVSLKIPALIQISSEGVDNHKKFCELTVNIALRELRIIFQVSYEVYEVEELEKLLIYFIKEEYLAKPSPSQGEGSATSQAILDGNPAMVGYWMATSWFLGAVQREYHPSLLELYRKTFFSAISTADKDGVKKLEERLQPKDRKAPWHSVTSSRSSKQLFVDGSPWGLWTFWRIAKKFRFSTTEVTQEDTVKIAKNILEETRIVQGCILPTSPEDFSDHFERFAHLVERFRGLEIKNLPNTKGRRSKAAKQEELPNDLSLFYRDLAWICNK